MPTYEYECLKCGRVFEEKQRISAAPLTTCEKCGGAVRRLLSAAPFILKGEGWYVTDYPSEARKKARESEKGGDKKPAAETTSSDKSSPETASPDKASAEKSSTAASSSSTAAATSSKD